MIEIIKQGFEASTRIPITPVDKKAMSVEWERLEFTSEIEIFDVVAHVFALFIEIGSVFKNLIPVDTAIVSSKEGGAMTDCCTSTFYLYFQTH